MIQAAGMAASCIIRAVHLWLLLPVLLASTMSNVAAQQHQRCNDDAQAQNLLCTGGDKACVWGPSHSCAWTYGSYGTSQKGTKVAEGQGCSNSTAIMLAC